jgi:hypothetical protein
MRKFRPDVVICRFPPDTNAGHGQHAASAIIAAKAYQASGNKMQYTEQLHYYPAWQPKRLLFNTFRFGNRNTIAENQFKLAVGQYVPAMGMGTGELAGLSRSVHKSQGEGTPSTPGVQTEYFKLVAGDTLTQSIFDGIDITWNRVGRPDIGDDISKILAQFNYNHPDASLPALLAVRKKIATVKDDYWRKQKLAEIDRIITDCTGLMVELYTKQPQAVRGAGLSFTLRVIARSSMPVTVRSISWGGVDTPFQKTLPFDSLLTIDHTIRIPADEPYTQPYWLSRPHPEAAMFSIPNDTLLGLPEAPNPLQATLSLQIDGLDLDVQVPLSYKKLDPLRGDVVEQLRIVPDVSVSFNTSLFITRPDGSVDAEVRLHAYKDVANATLTVSGDKSTLATIPSINLSSATDTIIPIHIPAALAAKQGSGDFYLSAELAAGGQVYNMSQHLIQYTHIPTLQYFTPPFAKVLRANWKSTVKRIGYIDGAGDFIPSFLRLAGYEVDVLKDADFSDVAKLKKYDAIITGIRAANVEKRMAYWLPVLFEYVHNGGTLVMQYNTLQDLCTTKLGPYPFTVANLRVTEEDAKITVTDPKSRLLNYPNQITDKDFDGWVQERGLYFPSKWDDGYHTIFEMHDANEQPLNGSVLYAKYGKGNYIYTGLSFSRQVPAGNKGAIRLLMNMISVGK